MDEQHKQLVARIAARVWGFYQDRRPFNIYHGSTNSTRIMSFKRDEMVDVSELSRVLSIDAQKRTAIVEANVPMDHLVRATRAYSLIPPVVMEFPGITVGGGVQGGAGESSSFKWGCFNHICNWYEMILTNGDVIRVSPEKHADLFWGTAGSYGSLGIITAAEIKLIPATRYVVLEYLPVDSFTAAKTKLQELVKQDYDFIDGIMFSPNEGVVMAGRLSNTRQGRVRRFRSAHNPWFYLRAERISNRRKRVTESIPLWDYLFRYDRGAFWVGRYAFERLSTPYNAFMRWVLNPILHTRTLYKALQASGISQQYIVQDLALPEQTAVEFMEYIDKSFGIYPLWLCPLQPDHRSTLQSSSLKTDLVINIGVWGPGPKHYDTFVDANRAIERCLKRLGGKKWFYAHAFYTEKEFWDIYDKTWYDNLRKKYYAASLPTVFEKMRVRKQYEINAKRGLWRAIFYRNVLRIED